MSTRSRQKTRWGQVARLALSALGLLLFTAALLLIYVWHVPQSPAALQAQVKQRLEAATGALVRFDGPPPRLLIPERRLEIRDVSFYTDEESTGAEFSLGRIDVTISPLALLGREKAAAERIIIGEPTRIDYAYGPDGLHPGESARFLAQTLSRLGRGGSSAAGEVQISDIEVAFYDTGSGLETGETHAETSGPAAVLRGELTATASPVSGTAAEFDGLIDAGGLHSTVKGLLTAASPTSRTLALTLGKLRLPVPVGGQTAQLSAEEGTELRFGLNSEGSLHSVTGSANVPSLEIEAPHLNGFSLSDRNLDLVWDGDYDTSSGALLVREADFASDLVQAEISGTVSAAAPHEFDLWTTATRLGGAYRDLLERMLPAGYGMEGPADSFRLAMSLVGDEQALRHVGGSLAFTSITLASPALPKPLEELSGEVHFRPDLVQLRSLSGRTGRTHVELDGQLSGNYLSGDVADVELNWKTRASARDLAAILATAENLSPSEESAAGTISGSGTLRHRVSLRGGANGATPPEMTGALQLANVSFAHPSLPAPVRGLSGTLKVESNLVQVDNLTGEFNGTPAEVRGTISGDRYFWRDPVLTATITSQLDLAQLPGSVPAELQEAAARYKLRGLADARLLVEMPLRKGAQGRITGSVNARNVAGEIEQLNPPLEIRDGEASLSWDGTALILDRMAARLNGEPFTASGLLSNEQLSLTAKGAVELSVLPRTFPKIGEWFELSGPATVDLRVNRREHLAGAAEPTPGAAPVVPNLYADVRHAGTPTALAELLRSAGSRLVQAVSSAGAEEGVEGSITLGNEKVGARIRHNGMPGGARKDEDGRPIPQGELKNVRGRLVLKGNLLTTPKDAPLRCDLADTKNCTISGTVEFRPGNFPRMTLVASTRGEAVFDTWLTGWGKELRQLPEPPDTGRAFDLDVTFTAPRATYKGQPAGRTRLELTYSLLQRPNSPRRTVFKRLEVQGSRGGQTIATGELLSYVWKPNEYPKWNAQARFDQMGMLPLLTWIFRDVRNIDGFATGELQVEGIKTDPLSIRGQGSTVMTNLVIDRTPLIQGLARQTGRQFQGRRFSSVDTTNFVIGDGAMSSRDLNLDSAGGLLLEMRGSYFFANSPRQQARAQTIRAVMRLKIFESMLQQLPIVSGIPLVGELASGVSQMADQVAGAFLLAFEVSGPVSQPLINPVALPVFQGAE